MKGYLNHDGLNHKLTSGEPERIARKREYAHHFLEAVNRVDLAGRSKQRE